MVLSEAARSLIFTWSCNGGTERKSATQGCEGRPGEPPPGRSTRGDPPGGAPPAETHPGRCTRRDPPGKSRPGRSARGDPSREIHSGRSTRGAPTWEIHLGSPTRGDPPREIHPGRSRATESAIQSQWAGPWGSTSVFADLAAPILCTLAAGYRFPGRNFQRLSSTHLVTVGGPHYGFGGGPGTRVRPVRHNPWGHSLELLWKTESGEVS